MRATKTCSLLSFSTELYSGEKTLLYCYLLRTGWCWGARREGALVSTRLVREGILNICILVTFPLAFLKSEDGIGEDMGHF